MPAISGTAPGKIILFGEHAVVYGYGAIAIPVHQVQARAVVTPLIHDPAGTVHVSAPDIALDGELLSLPEDHPIRQIILLTLDELGLKIPPAMHVLMRSSIPIAGGLGSGAAVSVAIIRAISTYVGRPLPVEVVSSLAFEVEKIHHGTPSGIDNTVIAYQMPVIYRKGHPVQTFQVGGPFHFLIADSGIQASTGEIVRGVRERRDLNPEKYDNLFGEIDALTGQALQSLTVGDLEMTGRWITENHSLLQKMDVSSPELDRLVDAALKAGAFGAKLSGAGCGGNIIALIPSSQREMIEQSLLSAGAIRIIQTRLE
jgi:mevalonate kinase